MPNGADLEMKLCGGGTHSLTLCLFSFSLPYINQDYCSCLISRVTKSCFVV